MLWHIPVVVVFPALARGSRSTQKARIEQHELGHGKGSTRPCVSSYYCSPVRFVITKTILCQQAAMRVLKCVFYTQSVANTLSLSLALSLHSLSLFLSLSPSLTLSVSLHLSLSLSLSHSLCLSPPLSLSLSRSLPLSLSSSLSLSLSLSLSRPLTQRQSNKRLKLGRMCTNTLVMSYSLSTTPPLFK